MKPVAAGSEKPRGNELMDHDVPAVRAGLFRAQDRPLSFPFRDRQGLVCGIGDDDAAIGGFQHGEIVWRITERDGADRFCHSALVVRDHLRHALGLGGLGHQGEEASALYCGEPLRIEQCNEGLLLPLGAGKAPRLGKVPLARNLIAPVAPDLIAISAVCVARAQTESVASVLRSRGDAARTQLRPLCLAS